MKTKEAIQIEKERLTKRIETVERLTTFVEKHAEFLDANDVNVEINIINDSVDFNWPDRKKLVTILLHFGGQWKKQYNSVSIDYLTTIDNVNIRVYGAQPPDNCKIVEVIEEVPETVNPARKVKKYKIVCDEEKKDENVNS